ncbi:MAG: MFS transporter [Succinivibrionaceae bacterium]|nr:MFS transporter [Succinivibrionaceae bacterium]
MDATLNGGIRRALVLSVGITSFCAPFMSSSLNVALPTMAEEFGEAPESLTALVSAYVILATAALLPATALASRLGFRSCYALGALLSALTPLLVALAPTLEWLLAARALQGLTNAILFSTGMALLTLHITDPAGRGMAIGLVTACVYAGLTLSPSLGGLACDLVGWRAIFYVAAGGNLAAWLLVRRLPSDPGTFGSYPRVRMSLAFLGILLALGGLSLAARHPLAPLALLAGLLVTAAYLRLEARARHPVASPLLIMRNRPLSLALLCSLLNFCALFPLVLLLSMHCQLQRGLSAAEAGLLLMVGPSCQCLVSVAAGRLLRSHAPHALMVAGVALSTAGTALLSFISPQMPLWLALLGQALCGLGLGTFSVPCTAVVMGSVRREELSLAAALQALSRNLGMALSMAALTIILLALVSAAPGDPLYSNELEVALRLSFSLATLLGILSLCACVRGAAMRGKDSA